MSKVAHLYKITNVKTGEYYIGKHNGWTQKTTNGYDYWGSGKRIQNQIKKFGKQNFTYQILAIGSVEYIYELENKYVTPQLIESDNKCLNLTSGGEGVKYFTEQSKQKHREARAKQIMPADMYEKTSKIMSSLVWMNDGFKSYRVKPENIQASEEKGLKYGRLVSYVDDKYKEKLKMATLNQWQKVKETGHVSNLIKV